MFVIQNKMEFVSMFQCRNQKRKTSKEFKMISKKLLKVQIVKERNLILFHVFLWMIMLKQRFQHFSKKKKSIYSSEFKLSLNKYLFEINHFDSALNLENDQQMNENPI